MKLINLIEEDFTNYRKPGMFLGFPHCSGKCNSKDCIVCQNESLRHIPESDLIDISIEDVIDRYRRNRVVKCLIFGGLEPFDSFYDLNETIAQFRSKHDISYSWDPIIIYTGYYPFEIEDKLAAVTSVNNNMPLIVKFGRYIPGHKPHYDPVLGVKLASDNQYALQYSWEEAGPVWNNFMY